MAPLPHIYRDAVRRPEQIAADDVIGTEAGRADFQYPVPGRKSGADTVAHEPMERA